MRRMSVQDRFREVYSAFFDGLADISFVLVKDAYKWPTWVRRVYLLTWPVAFVIRWACVAVLFLFAFIIAWTMALAFSALALWRGEPFRLD